MTKLNLTLVEFFKEMPFREKIILSVVGLIFLSSIGVCLFGLIHTLS